MIEFSTARLLILGTEIDCENARTMLQLTEKDLHAEVLTSDRLAQTQMQPLQEVTHIIVFNFQATERLLAFWVKTACVENTDMHSVAMYAVPGNTHNHDYVVVLMG
jgi:hypothetical protein